MQYQTVFDISTAGYKSASFAYHGLILVAIGILLVIFRNHTIFTKKSKYVRTFKNPKYFKIFSFIYLGFSVLWVVTSFIGTFSEYSIFISDYNKGDFQVVEGHVTNFVPMPASGHSMERFCVDNSVCFEYSDYMITAGFNNAKSLGGPISEGLPVRVSYVGNVILKLEVGKE